MFDSHISFEFEREVTFEQPPEGLVKLVQRHGHNQVESSLDGFMRLFLLAIASIPTTSGVIAPLVTEPISEVFAAVSVVFSSALDVGAIFTISSIKHALRSVTGFVADSILEYVSTRLSIGSSCVTILPWIDTQVAVTAVKVAMVIVAFCVASLVPRLGRAAVQSAIPLKFINSSTGRHVDSSWR